MSHLTKISVQYKDAETIIAAIKATFGEWATQGEITVEHYDIGQGGKLNPYESSDLLAELRCEIIMRRQQVKGMRWNDLGFHWDSENGCYSMIADDHYDSMPFPRSELPKRFSSEYVVAACQKEGFVVNRDQVLEGRVIARKPQTETRKVYA